MSRNSSTPTTQFEPQPVKAEKYSHAYFKQPQAAAKPIGYFNQSMVQIVPESEKFISTPQTNSIAAVKYSYASSPKVVRHTYHSQLATKSQPIDSTPPLSIQKSRFNRSNVIHLLSGQFLSLQQKIQGNVKWLQTTRYRQITDYLDALRLTTSKKDLQTIEALLDRLIQALHNSPTTKALAQDTAHWFTQQTIDHRPRISAASLSLLHRIQVILQSIAEKQLSSPTEADINEFSTRSIRNLQGEKISLQRKVAQLNQSHQKLETEVSDYSSNLLKLTRQINEQSQNVNELHGCIQDRDVTIQARNVEIQSQLAHVESLRQQLDALNHQVTEFVGQKDDLVANILDREQALEESDRTIKTLKTELAKYDQIRILEGKYVGVPSSKGSKYHFHKKCSGWKMLVGEYMLNLDPSRAVLSSKDASFFTKCGLTECLDCKNKSH
jgi:methyl-accepting chemotaxis protein